MIVEAVLVAPDIDEIEPLEAVQVMRDGGDAEAEEFRQLLPVPRRGDEQLDQRPACRVREEAVDILIRLRRRDLRHDLARLRALISWGCEQQDRKSTRLNSSHANISYAVF